MAALWNHTLRALRQAMARVRQAWEATAHQAGLSPTQEIAYLTGLRQPQSLQVRERGTSLQGTVQNLAPEAQAIEAGTPLLHLPSVIRWGQTPASRRNAQGRWYIIVPFRHLAPGGATRRGPAQRQMSWPVYRRAQRLQQGQSLTAGPSQGGGVHTPGLTPYMPAQPRNRRPGDPRASIHERLRRETSPAGARYMTFRTLTEDSPGWWIPARPGHHLADQVRGQMTSQIQAQVADAVRQDVAAWISDQLTKGGGL